MSHPINRCSIAAHSLLQPQLCMDTGQKRTVLILKLLISPTVLTQILKKVQLFEEKPIGDEFTNIEEHEK